MNVMGNKNMCIRNNKLELTLERLKIILSQMMMTDSPNNWVNSKTFSQVQTNKFIKIELT